MSSLEHAKPPPPPEEDRLPTLRLTLLGLSALALLAAATLFADWERLHLTRKAPPLPPPAQLGQLKINMVNQQLFPLQRTAADRRAEKLKRLHGYGWVDERRGLVHIPIERAKELVVGEGGRR